MLLQNIRYFFILIAVIILTACSSTTPVKIKNSIDKELVRVAGLGRHNFEITVRGSVVTLDGFVSSASDSKRVEEAALSVKGVTHVVNKLRIVGNSLLVKDDLAKRIRDLVKANDSLKNYNIEVVQEEGKTMLFGQVASYEDKHEIEKIAYGLDPERAIISRLQVKSEEILSDAEINDRVMAALKSEEVTGLTGVLINTKEGVVNFQGQVSDHREIDQMLSVTLMVEGVKSVRSEVSINSQQKK